MNETNPRKMSVAARRVLGCAELIMGGYGAPLGPGNSVISAATLSARSRNPPDRGNL